MPTFTTTTVVDAEATVRSWARSESHINAVVAARVFFSTPQSYATSRPDSWITLSLVSETFEAGDLSLQKPLVQFTCWGKDKATAASVAMAVETAARQLSYGLRATVGSAVILTGDVQQKRWFPDATTNTPRYVVDLLFAMFGPEAAQ